MASAEVIAKCLTCSTKKARTNAGAIAQLARAYPAKMARQRLEAAVLAITRLLNPFKSCSPALTPAPRPHSLHPPHLPVLYTNTPPLTTPTSSQKRLN